MAKHGFIHCLFAFIFSTIAGMDDEENETCPLHEMLDDKLRVTYFKGYLAAVSQAIR